MPQVYSGSKDSAWPGNASHPAIFSKFRLALLSLSSSKYQKHSNGDEFSLLPYLLGNSSL